MRKKFTKVALHLRKNVSNSVEKSNTLERKNNCPLYYHDQLPNGKCIMAVQYTASIAHLCIFVQLSPTFSPLPVRWLSLLFIQVLRYLIELRRRGGICRNFLVGGVRLIAAVDLNYTLKEASSVRLKSPIVVSF